MTRRAVDETMEDEREKADTLDKEKKCLMHKICKIETKETRIGAINKYLEPILEKIRISKLPGRIDLSIDSDSYFQSLRRWYSSSSRDEFIAFLWELVKNVEEHVEYIGGETGEKTSIFRARLKDSIVRAVTGLAALSLTYESDSNACANLSLLSEKLLAVEKKL